MSSSQMGFPGYFLICLGLYQVGQGSTAFRWGQGRGFGRQAPLSLTSLSITGLDPLRYGLLFERFLNPERVSMPDFDIDFCQDRARAR